MSRLRFSTAQEVFDTFPSARKVITTKPELSSQTRATTYETKSPLRIGARSQGTALSAKGKARHLHVHGWRSKPVGNVRL